MAHLTAINHCRQFLSNYCTKPGRLLDVGGEGGEYSDMAHAAGHLYFNLGVGDGVDYNVADHPYNWSIKEGWFDYVICASTMEHIPFFWQTMLEMARVTKPQGYIFLCVPSAGYRHWDLDCWRFLPDSMQALARWANVMPVQVHHDTSLESAPWHDVVGIFQKP